MSTLRDLIRDADPLAQEGEWSAETRAGARQTVLQSARASETRARNRSVFTLVAAAVVLAAGLGVAASLMSPGPVDVIAAVRFELRLAEEAPRDGLQAAVVTDSKRTVYLHPGLVTSNADVAKADAQRNPAGDSYSLAVTFTPEGARKMEAATRVHSGKPLAVLIDGAVVTCPTVRGIIRSSAVVDARYTKADADRIVAGIIGR